MARRPAGGGYHEPTDGRARLRFGGGGLREEDSLGGVAGGWRLRLCRRRWSDGRVRRGVVVLVDGAAGDLEEAEHDDEEERNEEDGEDGSGDHAADDAGSDGVLAPGTGAGGKGERHNAEDEGEGGHQDGPKALVGGVDGGFDEFHALLVVFLGELDDENGVLGGEADGGEEADLEEDVVGESAHERGEDGPEDTERNDEHDGEGNGPAFVERGKAEENDGKRDGVERADLRARALFLVRGAGPIVGDALGHLGGERFHDAHGLAGADASGGLALDLDGGDAVVALELG